MGVFLDTRFIESVIIQMTGIYMKLSTLVEFYKVFGCIWWIYMKYKCLWHGKMNALYLYTMQYMMLELWII